MNRISFSIFRFAFLFVIVVMLALLVIEQRLQAKEYEVRLSRLRSEIESIEFQKRDITLRIKQEQSRIAQYTSSNIAPISMNDIVTIRLNQTSGSDPEKQATPEYKNPLDGLFSLMLKELKK